MEPADGEFDVRKLIADCFAIVRPSADAKRLDLQATVDERVSPAHIGDALRLTQVLLNLLNNAIRATHHGCVAVSIEILDAKERMQSLRFCVRDTGIGIPRERVEALLQFFAQVESKIEGGLDENGVNLTICKQIVETMGGRMGAANNPDKGASFWFSLTLPVKRLDGRAALDMSRPPPVDPKETLAALLGPALVNTYRRQLGRNLQDFIAHLSKFSAHAASIRNQAHGLVSFGGMVGPQALSESCAKLHADISAGLVSLPYLEKVRATCVAALAEISGDLNEPFDENGGRQTERRQIS
jgi:hypothetical protein